LEGLAIQTRGEFGRDVVGRELLSHSLHIGVTKRSPQAMTEAASVWAGNEPVGGFMDQQVKEGIIRR
jgi:hypothetical protein